jgi:hypothetical protein
MTNQDAQPDPSLTAQAIQLALAGNMLARCPIHPDVLIAIADANDVSAQSNPQLQATISAVMEVTPHYCPLCVNADPE